MSCQWGCWLALILLLTAGVARAEPVKMGYFLFCAENPAHCTESQGREPDLLTLGQINRAVNHAIVYAPDIPATLSIPEPTLVLDYWTIDPSHGDCEDYAATKLDLLLKAGISRQSLRFAMGYENNEAHAVLLATVGNRVYVLDSLTDDVKPLGQSTFILVMQEALTGDRPAIKVVRP